MLHEAATINKAIEQAWCDAGKPSEFTIKVLDAGKKGLLWFSKRPAIISISYDPKTVTEVPPSKQSGKSTQRGNRPRSRNGRDNNRDTRDNSRDSNRDNNKDRNNRDRNKRSADDRGNRSTNKNKELGSNNRDNNKVSNSSSSDLNTSNTAARNSGPSLNVWSPEAVDYVTSCLQDITKITNITSKFSANAEKKVLTITFEDKVHSSTDEERMLFISLSYILMQFLKKKFKKKFRGFQLMLSTKAAMNNNANKKSSSS